MNPRKVEVGTSSIGPSVVHEHEPFTQVTWLVILTIHSDSSTADGMHRDRSFEMVPMAY